MIIANTITKNGIANRNTVDSLGLVLNEKINAKINIAGARNVILIII